MNKAIYFFALYSCITPFVYANQVSRIPYPNIDAPKMETTKRGIELTSRQPLFKPDINLAHPELLVLNWANNKPDSLKITNSTNISSPKTKEEEWLYTLKDSLLNIPVETHFENEQFYTNLAISLDRFIDSKATEIGYLTTYKQDSGLMLSQVKHINGYTGPRYVLSFDGNDIIYFDLKDNIKNPLSRPYQKQMANYEKQYILESTAHILLPKTIKRDVIENSINKSGVIEANHISIKDNYIILDIKEVHNGNINLSTQVLEDTFKRINPKNKKQISENLLPMEWKPRKRRTHIGY